MRCIHLLVDIVFMETVGMRPVVVHGGGAAISRAMAEAGLEPRFVQGRRYTDDATLDIVERVLADEINEQLGRPHRRVRRPGHAAELPHHQRPVRRADHCCPARTASRSTWATSATVTDVDRATIENLCYAGIVPVIPSMCHRRRTAES